MLEVSDFAIVLSHEVSVELIGLWEIWKQIQINNFHAKFKDCRLRYL